MQGKPEKNINIINAQQEKIRIYKNARENYYKQMRPYGTVRFVN
jgi:hypothetical protein